LSPYPNPTTGGLDQVERALLITFGEQLGTEALMIPDNTRLFLTTGMMGGLTTFDRQL
jgi:hypothetical protein